MSLGQIFLVIWLGVLMPALIISRARKMPPPGAAFPTRTAIYSGTWILQVGYFVVAWMLLRKDHIAFLPPWQFDAYGLLVAIVWVFAKLGFVALVSIWWKRRNLALMLRLAPRWEPKTIALYAAICCTTGVAEELVFRVHLANALLAGGFGLVGTLVASGVIFGAWHAAQGWRGGVLAGILGAANLLIYWHLGSIYPVMLSHALYDLVCGLRIAWRYRNTPVPEAVPA